MTEEGVDGEAADFYLAACSETPSLLSYTRRYVSLAEVGRVFRFTLREPMHLCTSVSEEGDDGEAARSETPSLLSYTLTYVSFTEVVRVCRVALREPMHLCTCMSEEGSSSFNKTTHFLFLFFLPFLGGRSELFFFPNGK
jgi:hypothetical protein